MAAALGPEPHNGDGKFAVDSDNKLVWFSFAKIPKRNPADEAGLPHQHLVSERPNVITDSPINESGMTVTHSIPARDKWIFDQTEDLNPVGSKHSLFREHLIDEYVRTRLREPSSHDPVSTLFMFNDTAARLAKVGSPDTPLNAPYRVEVEWHDDTKFEYHKISLPLQGIPSLDVEVQPMLNKNVSFPAYSQAQAEEIYKRVGKYYPEHASLLKLDRFAAKEKWAVVVDNNDKWTLIDENNEEEYNKSLSEAMVRIPDYNILRQRKTFNNPRLFEMYGDDGKDMFYESASEGEVDFKELYKKGTFKISSVSQTGAEMHSVEINLNPTATNSHAGWEMDGEVVPWTEEGEPYTTVLKEKSLDHYELATGKQYEPSWANPRTHSFEALSDASEVGAEKQYGFTELGYTAQVFAVKEYINGWQETHEVGDMTLGEAYESLNDTGREDMYSSNGAWIGEEVITAWDQDDVMDALESGKYGNLLPNMFGVPANGFKNNLPYDLAFVQGVERPVLFPNGELTMEPSLGAISWRINRDGPAATFASTTDFPITDNEYVKVGKGAAKLKTRFSETTFKFSRSFKDRRGKKTRYESKPAGAGLVIWKEKRNAQASGQRARELGWLIRTVPVGGGWVNLANFSKINYSESRNNNQSVGLNSLSKGPLNNHVSGFAQFQRERNGVKRPKSYWRGKP